MDKEIIKVLEQINTKLDWQGETLNEHSAILKEHSTILKEHSTILKEHSTILKDHGTILKDQSTILNEHSTTLKDHSTILNGHSKTLKWQGETLKEHTGILIGLRNGQEALKAEISELRLQNAKEIGEIKEQLRGIEDSVGVLKEDTWENKKDVHRIKKTMGMS